LLCYLLFLVFSPMADLDLPRDSAASNVKKH
jgi:hypothetical protein